MATKIALIKRLSTGDNLGFRNKVGGLPEFTLDHLPDRSKLMCKKCKRPLIFLLQVSRNVYTEESAPHNLFFLFICENGECYERLDNQNLVVFRCQLPFDYVKKPLLDLSVKKHLPTCVICGFSATLKCAKCLKTNYCCEVHLNYDWENHHQSVCGKDGLGEEPKHGKSINKYLLPEFKLVFITEKPQPVKPEKTHEEKMKEYNDFMLSSKAPKELQDVLLEDLNGFENKTDKAFRKFEKRIKLHREQVLRYQRGGVPLWISSDHVPSPQDIPDCVCGAKRVFEFQVMPQLLYYLGKESIGPSIDWGILAVYTCSKSCTNGLGYIEEFLWKQDLSEDHYQ